jgi:BirA family biotin operon repressor/biotin-[acetyl-CoA-carboxylase] ligase
VYSSSQLAAAFPSKEVGTTLFVFEEITSTNSFALDRIRQQPQDGTLVIANSQTAGRGRLDRQWFSPPGLNIYASILKPFPQANTSAQQTGWIPLLAGLAMAQALEETTGLPIALKWPNDLLVQGKKVGGLLCESATDQQGLRWVVIGFGLNVNQTMPMFPLELQETATSLQTAGGQRWDRVSLLERITTATEHLMDTFIHFQAKQIAAWREAYSQRCGTIGQIVQVQFPDGSRLTGLAEAIGDQGQLQVRPLPSLTKPQSDRIVDIHSGDIQHIRPTTAS